MVAAREVCPAGAAVVVQERLRGGIARTEGYGWSSTVATG
jgi:hypothetical protein